MELRVFKYLNNYVHVHKVVAYSIVLFWEEKLIVPQLVQKFVPSMESKTQFQLYKSLTLNPSPIQTNSVHIIISRFSNIHFNTVGTPIYILVSQMVLSLQIVWRVTLSRVWSVTIDGFWIDDRIYWTLWYSAWLHFTIQLHTHDSVHSHIFIIRCSVAASIGGRSPSSGLPNCLRPQLPAFYSKSLQWLNFSRPVTHSLTHQPTTVQFSHLN
jgi:hypothetical protein